MKISEKQRRCIENVFNNFTEEIFKNEFPEIPYEKVNVVLSTPALQQYIILTNRWIGGYYRPIKTKIYLHDNPEIYLYDNPATSSYFHELIHHMQFLRANKDYNKAFPEEPQVPQHKQKYEMEAHKGSTDLFFKYNKLIEKEKEKCYKLK